MQCRVGTPTTMDRRTERQKDITFFKPSTVGGVISSPNNKVDKMICHLVGYNVLRLFHITQRRRKISAYLCPFCNFFILIPANTTNSVLKAKKFS